MTEPNPITELDLDAYVYDQIAPMRRIEVEAYLAARPDMAAGVMADLRARDELRLALTGTDAPPTTSTDAAARKLARAMSRAPLFKSFRYAAVVAGLVATGWLANELAEPFIVTEVAASIRPPPFVEEAVEAHRTNALRLVMISQIEAPDYDASEIRSATAIRMPDLPATWQVKDVQIYPSQYGPSVAVAIDTPELGLVSLVAVRPGTWASAPPTLIAGSELSSVYFQVGDVAYALVSNGDAHALQRATRGVAARIFEDDR